MKRRGFIAALVAFVAAPFAVAGERRRRLPWRPRYPVEVPEYRWRGQVEYMRLRYTNGKNDGTYWKNDTPHRWGPRWRPCTRSEFYRAYRPLPKPTPTVARQMLRRIQKQAGIR
jgi:hypothetical protein